jgi:hypothetical protein
MYILRPDQEGSVWNEKHHLQLSRVPAVGEFIDMYPMSNRQDDDWYRVLMVVHCSSQPGSDANVFVEPVDYHEAIPQR